MVDTGIIKTSIDYIKSLLNIPNTETPNTQPQVKSNQYNPLQVNPMLQSINKERAKISKDKERESFVKDLNNRENSILQTVQNSLQELLKELDKQAEDARRTATIQNKKDKEAEDSRQAAIQKDADDRAEDDRLAAQRDKAATQAHRDAEQKA